MAFFIPAWAPRDVQVWYGNVDLSYSAVRYPSRAMISSQPVLTSLFSAISMTSTSVDLRNWPAWKTLIRKPTSLGKVCNVRAEAIWVLAVERGQQTSDTEALAALPECDTQQAHFSCYQKDVNQISSVLPTTNSCLNPTPAKNKSNWMPTFSLSYRWDKLGIAKRNKYSSSWSPILFCIFLRCRTIVPLFKCGFH